MPVVEHVPYEQSVFINCPLDPDYRPLLRALVFAVHCCGFAPRCAWEADNSGRLRLEKIYELISQCQFGIHDLSRIELDTENLPRFNMPFELGLDMGCQRFSPDLNTGRKKTLPDRRQKEVLVFGSELHLIKKYLSDLAGNDPKDHGREPDRLISEIRHFLSSRTGGRSAFLPGAQRIVSHYGSFCDDLPGFVVELGITEEDLKNPKDYRSTVVEWLRQNPLLVSP